MSISRQMDKEVVLHIYNGILLSCKKKCIWVSCNEVDETGDYYTVWSKSWKRNINIVYKHIYMEFRMMVMRILYARQQKKHRCKEYTFGPCGRRQGWEDLREQHWSMYITICKIDDQCKFYAWSRALKTHALGHQEGWGREGSGQGAQDRWTHVHTGRFMSIQCMAKVTTML